MPVHPIRTVSGLIVLAVIGSLAAYAEAPFGNIDTPMNGATNQAGAINFTGWALARTTVAQIALCREPVAGEGNTTDSRCLIGSSPAGLVFMTNAIQVPGVRGDVAAGPGVGYPNNNWGWGAQILTNQLPGANGLPLGNGTYKLHAIAADPNALATDLGTVTISVNNAASILPFGAIDTPAQAETVSGTDYVNFGWVVTPQPNIVPIDGSTIVVHISGLCGGSPFSCGPVAITGHPTYNNFRQDIATLFPNLRNSNGAVGFFHIDTTTLANGIHSIDWSVIDSAGNPAGVGSRYFFVQNGAQTMSFTGSPLTITAGSTGILTLNLSSSAPAGGLTVNLSSSDTSKATVPATVSFAAGASSAPVTVTGVAAGSATITASAPGLANATASVTVSALTMSFSGSLTINAGSSGNLTLNLSAPAPSGGLTVNLSSSDTSKATVPATVSFAAGASSAPVTVTGVAAGSATITASAPGLANATASVTVQASLSIAVPALTTVGLGLSSPFAVTLSQPAPAGGLTVNLASSDTTKVTAPASIFISAGATTPATQPQVTGAGIGMTSITASAIGYTPGVGTVTVSAPSMSFSGSPLIVVAGTTGNLTLNLSGGQAPAGGLTVNLSSNTPSVATVPANVTFAPGATSTQVTVTGVAQGSAIITASATGLASTTANVTVNATSGNTITITGASVGQNLQTSVSLSVSPPAPSGGLNVKVTSLDASKLLVGGQQSATGAQQVTFTVPQGLSTIGGIYLQGLASSGTVTIQASAVGYQSGSATITLTPSGFLMTGPGGAASFSTNVGAANSNLTVSAARLDSTLQFAEFQQVSGSLASTTVNVSNSNTSAGTVGPVTFAGGDGTVITPFTPSNVGSTTLTAVAPSGFSTPASGKTVTVQVNAATLMPTNVSVGKNLEAVAVVTGASQGASITVASNDSSRLLLSTTPTGAGSASITAAVPQGGTGIQFYVYGLASSGTVTYTATAAGLAPGTGTVTLTPSGFVIAGPGGIGAANFTATSASTDINVFASQLDSSGNSIGTQALAGGISASVNVTSSNTAVGTISTSPVTIPSGSVGATTQFVRGSAGTSDLTVNTPAGFNTPSVTYTKVTGTVLGMGFSLSCDQSTIGKDLELACTVGVGQAAPVGGLVVALTSNSPSLVLSTTATAAGSGSITVTIPAGSTMSSTYYAQALSGSGTVTHTASASGFSPRIATITLAPSGVVIAGIFGFSPFFSTSLGAGPVPVTVYLAVLNTSPASCSPQTPPCFLNTTQALRGGFAPVQVSLTSSNTGVGTIASPVSLTSGSDRVVAQFTPLSQGNTTVSLVLPVPGFTTSTNQTTLSAMVTP